VAASVSSPHILVRPFGRFDETTDLVEKAAVLTPALARHGESKA